MSRFTLAAVAEMMEYRNLNSYETPVHNLAGHDAEAPEAQGIVEWMLQTDHLRAANKTRSHGKQN